MTTSFDAMTDARYPCPCCGHVVFAEPPGSYDVCPVCDWEDDALQLEFATTLAGGANRVTLLEAQRTWMRRQDQRRRAPLSAPRRDPEWRPIDPGRDRFEQWGDPQARRPSEPDEALYYRRPTFWRRDPVT